MATGHAPGLSFVRDDIRHWEPQSLPDVIISNAVLHWVPGHCELLLRWADFLAEYGARLRAAYPPGPFGTFFPFRRVFAVARRPA